MITQTQAVKNILARIEKSLSIAMCPELMMDQILGEAQRLTTDEGFVFDVALAKACTMYPMTAHCGKTARRN
jgi:hypothetical protein